MKRIFYALFLLFSFSIFAQTVNDSLLQKMKSEIKEELRKELKQDIKREATSTFYDLNRFSLRGYGVVNYYNYDYDTDPNIKNKVDLERLNLYLDYRYSDWITINSEIEFEHGGTGSSVEFDNQQEFGEFEKEVEKGGSVKLEQLYVDFKLKSWFNLKVGKFALPFNLAQNLDDPDEYFTTYRPEMENELLPLGWDETGIEVYGNLSKRLSYYLSIVNGLDSTGFNSKSWIKEGYQERSELVNADSFALVGRIDYKFGKNQHSLAGISGYVGDSAGNRPKNDLKETAYVTIVEGHFSYFEFPLRIATSALYGNIENSNIVSAKNAALSNELGVKRTPVGKNAAGFSTEVGYEVLHMFSKTRQMLYPFLRYDYYDSMQDVEGKVLDNARWQRSTITGGLNWFVAQEIIVKVHYASRRLGSLNYNRSTLEYTGGKQYENTFSLGLSFEF